MAIKTEMLHVRVREDLKAEASEIVSGLGFTISDVVRLLLTRIVKEKKIPAGLMLSPDLYEKALKESLEEAIKRDGQTLSLEEARLALKAY